MKRIIILSCLFIVVEAHTQPAASLRHIVDSSISKMQQYSLNRNEIDWNEFRAKVYKETKGISKLDKLLAKYPLFFQWINDAHSAVITPDKQIDWKEGRPTREKNITMEALKSQLRIERWGHVAYFRVPVIENVKEDIQHWSDSLCRIDPSKVKAWIIDLRLNSGETIASTQDTVARDQFYSTLQQSCLKADQNTFIAVLCGSGTSSSGENLLLGFKGRPNTIIIGEQTAGFVTSNNNFELDKNVNLLLATSYMQDRSGNLYKHGITPDIEVLNGDDFAEPVKDLKVQQALSWFKMRRVQ
jgi:carboxyl-terminal processing protease